MKLTIDKTGKLEKTFNKVVEKHFEELSVLKFVYAWRDKEKLDEEGIPILAEVFKLPTKDRDLWNYDVRIEVDEERWQEKEKDEKRKVAYHELLHIILEYDEADPEKDRPVKTLKMDSENRVCFFITPHDIVIKRFEKEMRRYGLSDHEESVRRFLNKIHKKFEESEE